MIMKIDRMDLIDHLGKVIEDIDNENQYADARIIAAYLKKHPAKKKTWYRKAVPAMTYDEAEEILKANGWYETPSIPSANSSNWRSKCVELHNSLVKSDQKEVKLTEDAEFTILNWNLPIDEEESDENCEGDE